MYGNGKITNRYLTTGIDEQLKNQRIRTRGYDGSMMSHADEGLTVTHKIVNNNTGTERVVLFCGRFKTLDSFNQTLGESATVLGGVVSKTGVVVENPVKMVATQEFFNDIPTRISRIEIKVDPEHPDQLDNTLDILQYHPARRLGGYSKNLQIEVRPTNSISNKIVMQTNSQIDNQTFYVLNVLPGATVSITYVLGASYNLPALLDKEFAAAVGQPY